MEANIVNSNSSNSFSPVSFAPGDINEHGAHTPTNPTLTAGDTNAAATATTGLLTSTTSGNCAGTHHVKRDWGKRLSLRGSHRQQRGGEVSRSNVYFNIN